VLECKCLELRTSDFIKCNLSSIWCEPNASKIEDLNCMGILFTTFFSSNKKICSK